MRCVCSQCPCIKHSFIFLLIFSSISVLWIFPFVTRRAKRHNVNVLTRYSVTSASNSKIAAKVIKNLTVQRPLRIFYNRVPKCGSSVLFLSGHHLSSKNGFHAISSNVYMEQSLNNKAKEESFVRYFMRLSTPFIFDRHLHFVDFERYNITQPLYINIIREPLERMVSYYYFIRFNPGHIRENMPEARRNMSFDDCVRTRDPECWSPGPVNSDGGYFKIIPYFCGQHKWCSTDSDRSLQRAKRNVEKHYFLVGIKEKYQEYITLLELLIPSFFKNITQTVAMISKRWHGRLETVNKKALSSTTKEVMKNRMKREYEFYDFISQRFHTISNRFRHVR